MKCSFAPVEGYPGQLRQESFDPQHVREGVHGIPAGPAGAGRAVDLLRSRSQQHEYIN